MLNIFKIYLWFVNILVFILPNCITTCIFKAHQLETYRLNVHVDSLIFEENFQLANYYGTIAGIYFQL